MNRDELRKKLDSGESWGFIKKTDSDDYLGWILIAKLQPIIIYEKKAYSEEHYAYLIKKQEERKKHPYFVRIIELRKDVHESGVYETSEDYRQNDIYDFSTFDEVEQFIIKLGYVFKNIKDRWELDAP